MGARTEDEERRQPTVLDVRPLPLPLVDSFTFWNENGGGPGTDGITGIQGVEVLSSVDDVLFTPVVGGPTSFAQVMSSPAAGQLISFAPITASFIEFNILSNYGDVTQTGFGEVLFDGSAVPEIDPRSAAAPLALCVGISLIASDRRRRPPAAAVQEAAVEGMAQALIQADADDRVKQG